MKKYAIPYKGLSVGRHSVKFELNGDFFKDFEQSEILAGELTADIEIERGSNVMSLQVDIVGRVEVECDRCLEACSLPVEFYGELIVRVSETVDEYDGEVMWISPMEGEVDLAQYLYESVVLGLPYQRVHAEDENGVSMCNPQMVEKFKTVTAKEFDQIVESKQAAESRNPQWEKLKEIKEKLNK